MVTKPILFSTEMVEAILDERKTQTRRVKKSETPQYQVGDVLWVRETWAEFGNGFIYKADQFQEYEDTEVKWKPSIHMPKKATRIFLEITKVRCERLQDISEKDSIAEGVKRFKFRGKWTYYFYESEHIKDIRDDSYLDVAKTSFYSLWQSINGKKYPWKKNPFVWVYEFKIVEKPKDF